MGTDIKTKDGIILRNVPDGTSDAVIKQRLDEIRAEGGSSAGTQTAIPVSATAPNVPIAGMGTNGADLPYYDSRYKEATQRRQSPEIVSQNTQPQSLAADLVRPAEFGARGVIDSLSETVGFVPDLVSSGLRNIGLENYVPPEGYYANSIKSGIPTLGKTLMSPVNRGLGFIDSEGNPTGKGGPNKPVSSLEKGFYGGGRGAGDAAAFMVPGLALAKTAKAGGTAANVGKALMTQPVVQVAAGTTGGATTQVTDNAFAGLIAALGTGVGASSVLNKLARMGATNRGEKRILALLTELGDGDTARGIQIAQQRVSQGGPDTALVDVAGIKGEKLARAAANVPRGRGAEIADDFVQTRAGGRGRRLQSAADKVAPNKMYEVLEGLNKAKRQSSAPLYKEAFAPRSDLSGKMFAPWDDRLQQFLDDPIIKQGMAKGIRIQQMEGLADGVPINFQEYAVKGFDDAGELIIGGTPNLRAMDAAKRGLDETINGARDDFGNIKWTEYLRAVDKVRRSLVNKLDDITTDQSGRSAYKEARAAYAGPASLEDAVWTGRKFLRGDEELTAKAVSAMSEGEKEAFRLGARREISSMINKDTQSAVTKFATKKGELWNKLRTVFPDDASFKSFRGDIESELNKAKTEAFVGPRTGSPTAGIQQDVAELGLKLPESAARGIEVAGELAAIRPGRAAVALARPALDWIKRPTAETAETLASALLETSPKAQKSMLDALMRKVKTTPQIDSEMVKVLMTKITAAQGIGNLTNPREN
tara:strand:+ start:791 stop:3076 length:2286 start_codon:yes stop_codon:yes gene_type:complete